MAQPDRSTICSPTAPGPPIGFGHETKDSHSRPSSGSTVCEFLPASTVNVSKGGKTPDVLDLYDEETYRQAWEDAVHLKEVDIELKKAQQRIVDGIDNEDLEAFLRSFDKQVQQVHAIPPPYDVNVPPSLDLHPSPDAEFTVDALRVALERLYTSAVVGVLRTVYEIQRIRHWEDDGYRTLVSLGVYLYAWLHERIIFTILLFASLLILVPSSRTYFFSPPAYPEAVQDLSQLDPSDPIRKAYDRRSDRWGAAATETSARNWANTVIELIRSISQPNSGGSQAKKVEGEVSERLNSRMKSSMDKKKRGSLNATGQEQFSGNNAGKGDKEMELEQDWDQKKDREKVTEMYLQPTMRVVQGIADKWERMNNALNPTPPWATPSRRATVFSYMVPLIFGSVVLSERMMARTTGLAFGIYMFGQPLLRHVATELDQKWPTWKIDLLLRGNILQDVPTNAQLILRVLRRAEHHQSPVRFEPTQAGILDDIRDASDIEDMSGDDVDTASRESGTESKDGSHDDRHGKKQKTRRMAGGIAHKMHSMADSTRVTVRALWDKIGEKKEEGTAVVTGHKEVDYSSKAERALRAVHMDQTKLGHGIVDKLPSVEHIEYPQRADRFYVWHKTHGAGHLILYPPSPALGLSARIEFTTLRPDDVSRKLTLSHDAELLDADHAYHNAERESLQRQSGIEPVAIPKAKDVRDNLIIPVNCIVGLRKTGLAFPARIAVGWALAAEGAGGTGLDITFVRPEAAAAVGRTADVLGEQAPGTERSEESERPTVAQGREETVRLSGIVRRDELYRRLIAIGDQRWEVF